METTAIPSEAYGTVKFAKFDLARVTMISELASTSNIKKFFVGCTQFKLYIFTKIMKRKDLFLMI